MLAEVENGADVDVENGGSFDEDEEQHNPVAKSFLNLPPRLRKTGSEQNVDENTLDPLEFSATPETPGQRTCEGSMSMSRSVHPIHPKVDGPAEQGGSPPRNHRKNTLLVEFGEGIANLIAGGPVVIDHGQSSARSATSAQSPQELHNPFLPAMSRRSLAGALMSATLEKQQKSVEANETKTKLKKASDMYSAARCKSLDGVIDPAIMNQVHDSLKGVDRTSLLTPTGSPAHSPRAAGEQARIKEMLSFVSDQCGDEVKERKPGDQTEVEGKAIP